MPRGRPKVLDFGLACEWFVEPPRDSPGKILGTPAYMAPRASHRTIATRRAAYGCVCHGGHAVSVLTGELPFAAMLPGLASGHTCRSAPAKDLNPAVPKDLNTLCQCCLEKVPARRLASARLFYATSCSALSSSNRFNRVQSIGDRAWPSGAIATRWSRH